MFKEQSDTFKYSFILFDFMISVVSFGLAFLLRFVILDPTLQDIKLLVLTDYYILAGVLAFNQIFSFLIIDLYHPRRIQSFSDEFAAIFGGVALNLLLTMAMIFFYKNVDYSRSLIVYFAAVNVFAVGFTHALVRRGLRRLRSRGYNLRSVVILGHDQSALRVKSVLDKHPMYGFKFLGFIPEKQEVMEGDVLGSMEKLDEILESLRPNVVISTLSESSAYSNTKILEACDRLGCDLKIVPGFVGLVTAHGRVETMEGLPIISIREVPARNGFNRVLKRLFDLTVSSLFITIFSPVFIILALLVKLTSKGPILFKQERVGLDSKKFMMLKFRSMYIQPPEASNTKWTTKNDPRVTPLGRFLRKTSLDEIPQFFNVLFGQMSVVGPRPERPFYVEQFKSEVQGYMRRHAVKAGITGWAQINGLRGDTSIEDRIEADIYYIENWSFLLDLKIVLLTPFKGVLDNNAY